MNDNIEKQALMHDREWEVNNMLTIEKLIDYLKQFDPKALVCYFETNTGDWQAQSPSNLWWLVRTAADERKELRKSPQIFHEGKMDEEIDSMMKYVQDNDVLIRF